MPKKSAANSAVIRLRGLLRELKSARDEAGDLPQKVRREVEAAFRADDLKTVGTTGAQPAAAHPRRKLGKKKS